MTKCRPSFPRLGPSTGLATVLFIEKEGFLPLFKAVKLAERYDLAIMSTKGMPVVACRRLADALCGAQGIPLGVLHDFDKAGFSIVGTFSGAIHHDKNFNERAQRYEFEHAIDVIDMGLRLADVQQFGLASEPVIYRTDPSENLEQNGATPEEIEFLRGEANSKKGFNGRRVELNAFLPADFVAWIEAKLEQHGIQKVIPDADTLDDAYRRAYQIHRIHLKTREFAAKAEVEARGITVPDDLDDLVRQRLEEEPEIPWDRAVADLAADAVVKIAKRKR